MLEPSIQALSDEELRGKTEELQQKIAKGASLDDILAEAFAVSACHGMYSRDLSCFVVPCASPPRLLTLLMLSCKQSIRSRPGRLL